MITDDLTQRTADLGTRAFFGKYRGTVSDNADPTNRGRLKVKCRQCSARSKRGPCPVCRTRARASASTACRNPAPASGSSSRRAIRAIPSGPAVSGATTSLPDPGGAAIKIWKTEKFTVRIDDGADELKLETTSRSTVTLASDIKSESGGATHTVGSQRSSERAGRRKSGRHGRDGEGQQRRAGGDVKWPARP